MDESIFGDPSKGGLIGRMSLPDRVSGKHSLSIFYYDVGFELPEGVELQRGKTATDYNWQAPGRDHFMAAFEHSVPMKASPDDPTTPLELARMILGPFTEHVGEGAPALCSGRPLLRGYEWHVELDGRSLWLVIFEYENPSPRPDGFRSFMGGLLMGGTSDSPFATDRDAMKRVRESIRVTSSFDPKVDLRLGQCPPKV